MKLWKKLAIGTGVVVLIVGAAVVASEAEKESQRRTREFRDEANARGVAEHKAEFDTQWEDAYRMIDAIEDPD